MKEYLVFLRTGKNLTIRAETEDEAREKAARKEIVAGVSTIVCLEI